MKSSSDLYSCNLVNPPYILSKPLTFLNNNNLQLYRLFTGVNHLNLLDRNVSRCYLLSSWQHTWFHRLHCKCFNVACQPASSVQIEGIWVRICWRLSFICCFWHWKFVGFHWPCSRIRTTLAQQNQHSHMEHMSWEYVQQWKLMVPFFLCWLNVNLVWSSPSNEVKQILKWLTTGNGNGMIIVLIYFVYLWMRICDSTAICDYL